MPSQPEALLASALRILRCAGRALLKQPRHLAWIAPLGWASMIWLLSARQKPFPGGGHLGVHLLTNMAHAGVFGILVLLLVPLAPRQGGWVKLDRRVFWSLALPTLTYAVLDELHQVFVEGRQATAFDVLTDATGIFCTLLVVFYLSRADASGRGLVLRLAGGLGLCVLSAALSTLA
ncbi:MAG: VanZ family protein [Planctomycetota bacterium]